MAHHRQQHQRQGRGQHSYNMVDLPYYDGPYPVYMLQNARRCLVNDVDAVNTAARKRIWAKCGILDGGERDTVTEGWADASDKFSWSRFPYNRAASYSMPGESGGATATVTSAEAEPEYVVNCSTSVHETAVVNTQPSTALEIVLDDTRVGSGVASNTGNETISTTDNTSALTGNVSETANSETVTLGQSKSPAKCTANNPILINDPEPTLEKDGLEIIVPKKRKPEVITLDDSPVKSKKANTNISPNKDQPIIEIIVTVCDDHVLVVGEDETASDSTVVEEGEITDDDEDNSDSVLNETTHIDSLFVIDREPSNETDPVHKHVTNGPSTSKEVTRSNTDKTHTQNVGNRKHRKMNFSNNQETQSNSEQLYQCDLCPTISAKRNSMEQHMKDKLHYTASLVLIDSSRQPYACHSRMVLQYTPAKYKSILAVCPIGNCPLVFPDIFSSMAHHKMCHSSTDASVYAVADLIKEESAVVSYKDTKCGKCDFQHTKLSKLHKHIQDKRHFKFPDVQDTQIRFLCIYCHRYQYNYRNAMSHLHNFHQKKSGILRLLYVSSLRRKKTALPMGRNPAGDHNEMIIAEIESLNALKKTEYTKPGRKRIRDRVKTLKAMMLR